MIACQIGSNVVMPLLPPACLPLSRQVWLSNASIIDENIHAIAQPWHCLLNNSVNPVFISEIYVQEFECLLILVRPPGLSYV